VVATTCAYCGVGCQLDLNVNDDVPGGRLLRVTSSVSAPVNGDHLCVKGRYGYDFVTARSRLTQPRVRRYLLEGEARPPDRGPWVSVDWDTALDVAAQGLRQARERHGAASLGVLASGRCLNEENYLLAKLARQKLGTNNIDCGEHARHPSVVAALDAALGLPAQTSTLAGVAGQAQSVLIIGSNTSEQHPLFGVRLRLAALQRGCKLVVAHPDFINMAEYAALRLVHRPGTEAALVGGLAWIILQEGWEDRAFIEQHTQGFAELQRSLEGCTPGCVAEITGVDTRTLHKAAAILATQRPMAVVWGTDLAYAPGGQSAMASLVNLQLLLGNFGTPGGGLVPLRTHTNSQGAADMGAHPAYYPGYQAVEAPATLRKFRAAWGEGLPGAPGLGAAEMLAEAAEGRLKALLVLSDDIAAPSSAGGPLSCDFLAVIGAMESDTTRQADVVLPGVTFAEKTGSFTNTERRVQLVRAGLDPLPGARPDWEIIQALAQRLPAVGVGGEQSAWNYASTAEILAEAAALVPAYAGVSHERLERLGSLQWPVKNLGHPGTPILSAEHFRGGRGQFAVVEREAAALA
jgi:predicted molibdopterin-dependent oxidoreductase YjgC